MVVEASFAMHSLKRTESAGAVRDSSNLVRRRREAPRTLTSRELRKTLLGAVPTPLLVRWGLSRFRVFVKVLPLTLLAVGFRAILDFTLGFEGLIPSSSVTPFAATCMFVIAIILGGVRQGSVCTHLRVRVRMPGRVHPPQPLSTSQVLDDYKEAERMPGAIAMRLEALSDRIELARINTARAKATARAELAAAKAGALSAARFEELEMRASIPEPHWPSLHGELLTFGGCYLEFLAGLRTEHALMVFTSAVSCHISSALESVKEVSGIKATEQVCGRFDELREQMTRVSVIKVRQGGGGLPCGSFQARPYASRAYAFYPSLAQRTNFIPTGAALLTVLVYTTCALLIIATCEPVEIGDGGGGGRRMLGAWGDPPEGTPNDHSVPTVTDRVASYLTIAIYTFLFLFVLELLDDLEDPCAWGWAAPTHCRACSQAYSFASWGCASPPPPSPFCAVKYSPVSLLPAPDGVGIDGTLSMHLATGGTDVDVYPILEAFARVRAHADCEHSQPDSPRAATLAGRLNPIEALVYSLRSDAFVDGGLSSPTLALERYDTQEAARSDADAKAFQLRQNYGEALECAMHTALCGGNVYVPAATATAKAAFRATGSFDAFTTKADSQRERLLVNT